MTLAHPSRSLRLGGAACLLLLAAAMGALAENSGEADRALLLGAIPTFRSEADARAACQRDGVVWADRYSGTYYYANEAQFGVTPYGAFACRQAAAKGGYWDTDPRSSMSGQAGRTFPYQPLYVGS